MQEITESTGEVEIVRPTQDLIAEVRKLDKAAMLFAREAQTGLHRAVESAIMAGATIAQVKAQSGEHFADLFKEAFPDSETRARLTSYRKAHAGSIDRRQLALQFHALPESTAQPKQHTGNQVVPREVKAAQLVLNTLRMKDAKCQIPVATLLLMRDEINRRIADSAAATCETIA